MVTGYDIRIFKTKQYIIEKRFKDSWGNWMPNKERFIISGLAAQGHLRIDVVGEAYISKNKRCILHDGHAPGYRPVVDGNTALQFLADNPYQWIEEKKSKRGD